MIYMTGQHNSPDTEPTRDKGFSERLAGLVEGLYENLHPLSQYVAVEVIQPDGTQPTLNESIPAGNPHVLVVIAGETFLPHHR